ncbi:MULTISPECIES: hypothetical protein [Streptomyces]|uniref:hypothetical protein n=1 Tax=Streptomyces TaxID=1883 RepID=UPI001E2D7AFC|nr:MULTISPECIES: hypothetical protein [Streptomyces]UFQ15988.1 hypothetical protein J2N69_13825 [Streptomyces huasconensis]WCL85591.1 hypothetical protein PPN52_13835 [Streptomyces sp. JCM 35825]
MRTLLQLLTAQRDWQSYPTFKAQFERSARELAKIEGTPHLANLAPSERTYERWYLGESKPVPDARRVLAHMFGHTISELLAPPVPGVHHPVTAPSAPARRPARTEHSSPDADAQHMGRQAAMAASRALRYAVMAETNSIGPETFDHLRDEVTRIGAAYPRVALHEILSDLTEVHDLIFRLLESGRATPAQGVDLQLLASMASGMLAKDSHDLSDPKSAMVLARAAYVCADQAGHNGMRAWVRGLQSLIAYWAGRPADAAAYAARGAAALTTPAGSVSVWLAALEARAHALLGDSEGVQSAVVRIDDTRGATVRDDLDSIGGILTFPAPRQAYYVAEAHVLLGGTGAEAEWSALEAVQAYATAPDDEWGFGDMAGAHTNLALARIARRDLEGATEAVHPVLDLPPSQHNHGIVVSARRVHEALTASPLRAENQARELRAELELFTSTPTPALPR